MTQNLLTQQVEYQLVIIVEIYQLRKKKFLLKSSIIELLQKPIQIFLCVSLMNINNLRKITKDLIKKVNSVRVR